MVSEVERRAKILDYIWKKSLDKEPNITKSSIMKDLKDSRPMTTYQITIALIKEGKLKMVKPKDKPYSQTDYLVINQDNEFNKIYNWLTEIEKVMNKMEDTAEKIVSLGEPGTIGKSRPEHWFAEAICYNFLGSFEEAIREMLDFLLVYTSHKINSEKDTSLIYTKIIRLILKSEDQESDLTVTGIEGKSHRTEILLSGYIRDVKSLDSDDRQYAVNKGIKNINLLSDLIESTTEKFKREFLIS